MLQLVELQLKALGYWKISKNQPAALCFHDLALRLAHICVQIFNLHKGDGVESIRRILIEKLFHVTLRILSPKVLSSIIELKRAVLLTRLLLTFV